MYVKHHSNLHSSLISSFNDFVLPKLRTNSLLLCSNYKFIYCFQFRLEGKKLSATEKKVKIPSCSITNCYTYLINDLYRMSSNSIMEFFS